MPTPRCAGCARPRPTWCCWTSACRDAAAWCWPKRCVRLPSPPAVVFVTAHAEHAVKAFELEAVDYLTKPVRRERLQAALQRVQQRRGRDAADPPVIVVHDRGRVLRLPVAEVLYLKAELKYVTLRTAERQLCAGRRRWPTWKQRLSAQGAGFIRIHRNALVARQRGARNCSAAATDRGEDAAGWARARGPARTNGWRCRAGSWRPFAKRCGQ